MIRTCKTLTTETLNKLNKEFSTEVVIANNEREATAKLSKRFGKKGSAVILRVKETHNVTYYLDDEIFFKYAIVTHIDGVPVANLSELGIEESSEF